ncbi:recombinase family protein [Nocardia sp. NPDC051833]|uniref:recombinase family protein n=1 Tax=Nocardia sp. NPDC051833 TaxID=3155674 RepID=UPI0034288C06
MPVSTGRRKGRPPRVPGSVVLRVVTMSRNGIGYRGICRVLDQEGVLTSAGNRRWYPSHVSRLLYTRNVTDRFGPPPNRRPQGRRSV